MQVKHICQIPTTIYIINDVLGLGGWNVSPRFEPYICMGACACARARARARARLSVRVLCVHVGGSVNVSPSHVYIGLTLAYLLLITFDSFCLRRGNNIIYKMYRWTRPAAVSI